MTRADIIAQLEWDPFAALVEAMRLWANDPNAVVGWATWAPPSSHVRIVLDWSPEELPHGVGPTAWSAAEGLTREILQRVALREEKEPA